jgi:hypothetical protein
VSRVAYLTLPILLFAIALPAQAQIYLKPANMAGAEMLGPEPGYGVPIPGANAAEQKAALVWSLRSALNVAALQCGFEPALRTFENYNALLVNNREELASSYVTLTEYFKRTAKTVKAGQSALDSYGTRVYSGFSAVAGQLNFCTSAGKIGSAAIFAPRGQLGSFAQKRLRELYNAVKSGAGEQQFPGMRPLTFLVPNFSSNCWKKNKYVSSCGMSYLN